jgi:hypothetical protein
MEKIKKQELTNINEGDSNKASAMAQTIVSAYVGGGRKKL